jgi:CheY-like chemotaxis protein
VSLVGDAGRLQQVFWNLLSNAIKFTPQGGRVAIQWQEHAGQVRIAISDTGQGIDADFLPHVFDRFSQANGEKRQSRAGLGLGLALVREMVHAHGGTVLAESPGESRGSTFTITLPVSSGSSATEAVRAPRTEGLESFSHLEILIVDDDEDGRDLLALLLDSRGATTRTASSAAEALEAIRQRRPDVLLADLRMPDEDGFSLIRKIRAVEHEQQIRRLPAIAVTAYASPSHREQALVAGYDSHVAKPVDAGELARAISQVAGADSV